MKAVINAFRQMRLISKMMVLLGIVILIPVLIVIAYPSEAKYIPSFAIPCVLAVLVGVLLELKRRMTRRKRTHSRQHEVVVVVFIWLFAFVFGAVPFYLSGLLGPLGSLFESVSGWTATGFTVVNVEETPHIFLFYRSYMQFIGGVGFVLLILLFATGDDAMRLFSAEGHPDKLEPNLIGTARYTMLIYMGFTAVGVIMYMIFGMDWLDAICHSMSALGTGGFSTKAQGIAYYNSLPIELVTIFLMLVGSTNFAALALVIKGKLKKFGDISFFAVLLVISIIVVTVAGTMYIYPSFWHSLRVAAFETVSAVSTTGYTITSCADWRPSMIFTVLILMLIGGGAGSTAGGMKYTRIYMVFKSFITSVRAKFMPERAVYEAAVNRPQGRQYLTDKVMLGVYQFCAVYMMTFLAGSLLLSLDGMPVDQAMFEFSSALGGVGMTTGATGAASSSYCLSVQIAGMILGRLEVYIVYVFIGAGIKKLLNVFRR